MNKDLEVIKRTTDLSFCAIFVFGLLILATLLDTIILTILAVFFMFAYIWRLLV